MRAAPVSALPLLSASQITAWRNCQRLWGWIYIGGIRTPAGAGAKLGTEVDDTQLQPYLRDGRPFDFSRDSGYIAAAGLAYLPKPKSPGLEVQKHFVLPSPVSGGRWAYQGYKDLWLPDSAAVPDMPGGVPFVGDFKTTSDFRWAKGESELKRDVQAMLYATNALYSTGAKSVDLSWMYFLTRGPRKAKRTYVRVDEDHVIEQFKEIEATATEMFEAKQTIRNPLDLPPTPTHCGAYGGCFFRDKCNLSPADYVAAASAQTTKGIDMSESKGTSSLLANLRAKKAGAQGTVIPTTPVPSSNGSGFSLGAAPTGESAPSPSPPVGINPPEKDLPPAPPVGTPKRGPGRPKKDPVAADFAGALVGTWTTEPAAPVPLINPIKSGDPFVIDYDKLAQAIVRELANRLDR